MFVEKLASLHLPIKRGSDSIKGMIRELRKGFLLAALATAVVSGCGGRDKGNATPTAAAQYEEIVAAIDEVKHEEWMQEEGFAQEIAALIGYFDRTADATYATPRHGWTMLHLACLFKKAELARCLLIDGADPNARTHDDIGEAGNTPLHFAVATTLTTEVPTEESIKLIDTLIQGGADPQKCVLGDSSLMSYTTNACDQEAIATHLLQYMPHLSTEDLAELVKCGWADTLEQALSKRASLQENEHWLLTAACLFPAEKSAVPYIRCIELLLKKGANINAKNELGFTALTYAAEALPYLDEDNRDNLLELIAFLLRNGADANAINTGNSDSYGLTAYDMLATIPGTLEALAAKGIALTPPPFSMQGGDQLPTSIIHAERRGLSKEEIAQHFDTIAAIFSPTEEMQHNPAMNTAISCAAILLAEVDASRASAAINSATLWQVPPHKKSGHGHTCSEHSCTTAAQLVFAMRTQANLTPELAKLRTIMQQALDAEDVELAAVAVELMSRCADATTELEELKKSPHAAIRAGAWAAELQRRGLPEATDGGVKQWLAARQRTADTPAVRTALLATSLEEMWLNTMTAERKLDFLAALRSVGAPEEAIRTYGEYADNMDNPEVLDKLSEQGNDWRFELEIATARFIIEHEEEFLTPPEAK